MQDYQPISSGEQRRSERPLTQSERIAYRNRMKKKKQNKRRMQIGGASVLLIVIIVAIILIVKGCSAATDVSALLQIWMLFLFALMKKMVKIQNLYCIRKDKNK